MESHNQSSSGNITLRGACYQCSAHGVVANQRSHVCPFSSCECSNCNVIRVRRAVVARQLRMRREEKKIVDHSIRSYTCNRCRNHGLHVPKKGHKNACPFDSCFCPMCTLCHSRSILDANFRMNARRVMKKVTSVSPTLTLGEETESSRSHSASPASFTTISPIPFIQLPSSSDSTPIPAYFPVSNPLVVTTEVLSGIPVGIHSKSFNSENLCPRERARVNFLLQSLPQSLQILIGPNTQL